MGERIKFKDLERAKLTTGFFEQFKSSLIIGTLSSLVIICGWVILSYCSDISIPFLQIMVTVLTVQTLVFWLVFRTLSSVLILDDQFVLVKGFQVVTCVPLTEWGCIRVKTGVYDVIILEFISTNGSVFFKTSAYDGPKPLQLLTDLLQAYPEFESKLIQSNTESPAQIKFMQNLKRALLGLDEDQIDSMSPVIPGATCFRVSNRDQRLSVDSQQLYLTTLSGALETYPIESLTAIELRYSPSVGIVVRFYQSENGLIHVEEASGFELLGPLTDFLTAQPHLKEFIRLEQSTCEQSAFFLNLLNQNLDKSKNLS